MTKIGKIKPYLFDDSLVIALSKDWINFFSNIPTFDVMYENGKLVIQSESKKREEN